MDKPFAVLDCSSKNKREISRKLIETAINNGFVFIIVKTEITIMDNYRKTVIRLGKCKSSIFYGVTSSNHIEDGITCIKRMRLWHKPVFHILICKQGTDENIVDLCKTRKQNYTYIENFLAEDILCYIDPVDDLLEFYGNGSITNIINDVFSHELKPEESS